ncbi:GNAT family N-acetyltransferase [Terrabacter sp. NPDC080008]|uniref:GNAT family N-acetyltransferase n=1 Tax=Terrabacter sp. NPDC080008 TaxID=3155176 RepID=UPI00344DD444
MAEDGWRLRPPTLEDCDELGRVHMAVWRDAYAGIMPADYLAGLSDERSAENWRRQLSAPEWREGQTLLVVDPSGALAGFAGAGPSRDEDAPTDWELYVVNLLPHARGTGVADRLLDELVGDRDATLWVVEDNARARAFYARRGFVDEGGRSEHPATGTPEIRLIRRVGR